jgi:carbonic anhydrase
VGRAADAARPDFFSRLVRQQAPQYLWIGCADSRVPANEIVGLAPGEMFVHRNVANIVVHADLNCLSTIQYAVDVLRVTDIIVCGHYRCGGVAAALRDERFGLATTGCGTCRTCAGSTSAELDALPTAEERHDRLCELNVVEQVVNVARTTVFRDAVERGQRLAVHGWIYDVADGEAAALLASAEARLLSNPMDLRFRVTAEGAFAAELEGVLRIDGHAVFLAADGGFGGAPVRLQLRAEGDSMRIVSPRGDSVASTPPQLREALVIGFTRMGILHNLARLTGGLEPDRAGGGVREWVEVQQVRLDLGAAAAGEIAVRFDIHVGGARTAEATLWFDADTGAPIRREQVVRFPGGEMRVEERYEVQF